MRLQARRHAQLDRSGLEISVPELVAAGGWAAIFDNDGPFSLEIGLGKDAHIIEQAIAGPDHRYVGLEYSRKKLDMVIAKVLRRGGVPNLRVMRADAVRILHPLFRDGSLEKIFVFFPDPWPKKRHRKKRLIQKPFVRLLVSKLVDGGAIELRTDDFDYRDQMVEVLDSEPGLVNMLGSGFALEPLDPDTHIPTLFEEKFRRDGRPIHYFYYTKSTTEG